MRHRIRLIKRSTKRRRSRNPSRTASDVPRFCSSTRTARPANTNPHTKLPQNHSTRLRQSPRKTTLLPTTQLKVNQLHNSSTTATQLFPNIFTSHVRDPINNDRRCHPTPAITCKILPLVMTRYRYNSTRAHNTIRSFLYELKTSLDVYRLQSPKIVLSL